MEEHPHGPMRRKDRVITDRAEIDEILACSKVMHLALADHDVPFLVPLFYTYDCVWQLGLAHFGSLFWPTPGTLGLRGYCSVLL
jgi:hypothetical protein